MPQSNTQQKKDLSQMSLEELKKEEQRVMSELEEKKRFLKEKEREIFGPDPKLKAEWEEIERMKKESEESPENLDGIEKPARKVELRKLDQINDYAEKSQPQKKVESPETTTPSETFVPEKTESQKEEGGQEETEQPVEQKNVSGDIPEDIKELITSPHTTQKIKLIAHKHQLDDHRQFLEDEIMEILRGKKSPETLMTSLEEELGLPEKQAESVVVDVNEHIFKSVRDSLRKMHVGSPQPTLAGQATHNQQQEEGQEPPIPIYRNQNSQQQKQEEESKEKSEEKQSETQTPKEKVAQPNRTVQEMLKEKTESREKQETQTKPALNETLSKEPHPEPEPVPEKKEEKDPWKEIEELKKRVEELKKREIGDSDSFEAGTSSKEQVERDPWKEIEEKKQAEESRQTKSEGGSEYHPGTIIDDKLSKRVKLPEHTEN